MHTAAPSPRPQRDNLLGVCHALGETFGIDPLYLRVLVALGILVNFEATAIAYLALGAVLLVSMIAAGEIRPFGRRRQEAGASLI